LSERARAGGAISRSGGSRVDTGETPECDGHRPGTTAPRRGILLRIRGSPPFGRRTSPSWHCSGAIVVFGCGGFGGRWGSHFLFGEPGGNTGAGPDIPSRQPPSTLPFPPLVLRCSSGPSATPPWSYRKCSTSTGFPSALANTAAGNSLLHQSARSYARRAGRTGLGRTEARSGSPTPPRGRPPSPATFASPADRPAG
jgi:hypothetical protein